MGTSFSAMKDALQDAPVIAAVKDEEGLSRALSSECAVIFLLFGSILSVPALVRQIKEAGKLVLVHADLIEGLGPRDITADFLATATEADGIISTRPNLIRRARELGLITIQRFFLLDSLSFENVLRQSSNADAVDILPGVVPRVIDRLLSQLQRPLIASGLLFDKQDIIAALSAGALAVSTTSDALWSI